MLRAIVGTSVRFRMLIIGIAGALLLIGATQVQSTRVDVLPEFTPPYVEVQTEALGLSAEEVEELVTVPLEADLLHGVAFLDEIRSESIPGLSSIVLIFEPGTDIFKARQVVAERLTQAHALPNVARAPVMLQPLSSLSRFMVIGMSSQEKSLIDMSVLARWTVRPRLMGVPGVANVSIFGQRERQLQVLVDPAKLDSNNVSLEHVVETAGNALWFSPLTFLEASTPGTGGFIDTPQQRLGIQHILPIQNAEDLAQVAIETEDGATPLKLGDVATVVEDHQQLIGDGLVNDGSGLHPGHREVPRRQHAGRHPWRRGSHGGPPAGPARHRCRYDPLPRSDVHRRLARQRVARDPYRLPAHCRDPGRAPVRLAGRADQPRHDPLVDRSRGNRVAPGRSVAQCDHPGRVVGGHQCRHR